MSDLFTTCPFPSPSGAEFSECGMYRYALWRSWGGGEGYVCFICLNPSTADATVNDPTVERCIDFAKQWGYAGFVMLNAFAYKATLPEDMLAIEEPIGALNDETILRFTKDAGIVVAGWGNHGSHKGRHLEVLKLVPNLHCLKITQEGQPNHPLYLKKSLKPIPYKVSP